MTHRMLFVLLACAALAAGCANQGFAPMESGSAGYLADDSGRWSVADRSSDAPAGPPRAWAGAPSDRVAEPRAEYRPARAYRDAPAADRARRAEAPRHPGSDDPARTGGYVGRGQQAQRGGVLTAGSYDDTRRPESLVDFAAGFAGQSGFARLARQLRTPPVVLRVVDGQGRPVGGARVHVTTGWFRGVNLTTRTDGRCVLLPHFDAPDLPGYATVRVSVDGQTACDRRLYLEPGEHSLAIQADTRAVGQLDLAFCIDCTGSMADELEYIQAEIRGISDRVARQFPDVQQRFALVCYRDNGDAYVTRKWNFHTLYAFQRALAAQSAAGGGDYPEAVDDALAASAGLNWSRDRRTARVLFHVADAPPHAGRVEATIRRAADLREKGVALYPIAASGTAEAAELTMRVEAQMTGSLYGFLTDDSGVGNPHAEPHTPGYNVEMLDDLIVRCIASELAGRPVGPAEGGIIRSAGQ